ncbi:energy transducer TonB [Hymenobacter sp. BRD128]|uniref:energy transducer TonB n=1 Tax=Hymenobacter sp. BRD128 TaxID=2675878 RepID=UPI001563B962|nr:energy transducer TonB [Hymenobacter sp. BRD128]QKG58454.1 energy transducer TonB [Hymenobacter sp. BRD128]
MRWPIRFYKQIFFLLTLGGSSLLALPSHAQQFRAADQGGTTTSSTPVVLNYAEQMPAFPGGSAALHQYLATHTNYPPEALRRGVSGQVVVQFVVDEQGRVLEPTVVKTTDAEFNEEARRLAWLMPRWTPGQEHGQPVRVRCTLPITFTFKR